MNRVSVFQNCQNLWRHCWRNEATKWKQRASKKRVKNSVVVFRSLRHDDHAECRKRVSITSSATSTRLLYSFSVIIVKPNKNERIFKMLMNRLKYKCAHLAEGFASILKCNHFQSRLNLNKLVCAMISLRLFLSRAACTKLERKYVRLLIEDIFYSRAACNRRNTVNRNGSLPYPGEPSASS